MQIHRVEAVIFDWAGTIIDHGCIAPMEAFRQVFAERGVPISIAEARAPMGSNKREHIEQLCAMPQLAERWRRRHGRTPDDHDVAALYARFTPTLIETLPQYAGMIDGALQTMQWLRAHGIAIGSTTGYTRPMMAVNLPLVAQQGFEPDALFCAGEAPRGRPYPDLCLKNVLALGVSDVRACVKVDDTLAGIRAGRAAGMWTVGVSVSGNLVGLSQQQWRALDADAQRAARSRAGQALYDAGADFVLDSIASLPQCIEAIVARASAEQQAAE